MTNARGDTNRPTTPRPWSVEELERAWMDETAPSPERPWFAVFNRDTGGGCGPSWFEVAGLYGFATRDELLEFIAQTLPWQNGDDDDRPWLRELLARAQEEGLTNGLAYDVGERFSYVQLLGWGDLRAIMRDTDPVSVGIRQSFWSSIEERRADLDDGVLDDVEIAALPPIPDGDGTQPIPEAFLESLVEILADEPQSILVGLAAPSDDGE